MWVNVGAFFWVAIAVIAIGAFVSSGDDDPADIIAGAADNAPAQTSEPEPEPQSNSPYTIWVKD